MLNRRRALLILQLTVAAGALIYVLWLVDWRRAAEVLGQADVRWLGAAFVLLLSGFVPAALRWTGLLRAMAVRYGRVAAYRAYLTGAFYGLAMPGVIGGDAARIWFCLRETQAPLTLVAGTVLAERVLGVVALLLILSLGIYWYPASDGGANISWAPLLALTLLGGIAAFPWMLRRISFAMPEVTCREHGRWGKISGRILKELAPIKRLGVVHLLTALVLSILFQTFDILSTYVIGQALGLELNVQMLLIAMPIVYLATVLPISPGGLGVREGTLVIVLAQFGLTGSDAALLALAVFLNRVAVGMVGAAQHLAGGAKLSREIAEVKRQSN